MKRTRINPISDKRKAERLAWWSMAAKVIKRDDAMCVWCEDENKKTAAQDIHEIVPRSRGGSRNMHLIFSMKNMICICRRHHKKAATCEVRCKLLKILAERYGYTYDEPTFAEFVDA